MKQISAADSLLWQTGGMTRLRCAYFLMTTVSFLWFCLGTQALAHLPLSGSNRAQEQAEQLLAGVNETGSDALEELDQGLALWMDGEDLKAIELFHRVQQRYPLTASAAVARRLELLVTHEPNGLAVPEGLRWGLGFLVGISLGIFVGRWRNRDN